MQTALWSRGGTPWNLDHRHAPEVSALWMQGKEPESAWRLDKVKLGPDGPILFISDTDNKALTVQSYTLTISEWWQYWDVTFPTFKAYPVRKDGGITHYVVYARDTSAECRTLAEFASFLLR
jgi:hypothetical protein